MKCVLKAVLEAVRLIRNPGDEMILDMPARELSSGMQQRLSVARMMLDESEIVIMDEPLAGVDIHTMRDLLPLLQRQLQDRKHT